MYIVGTLCIPVYSLWASTLIQGVFGLTVKFVKLSNLKVETLKFVVVYFLSY